MFGALIGDLIGSVYEWSNIKTKDFQPLIAPKAFLTDDSVLTVAVADALLHRRPMAESLKDWGRRYPDSDRGGPVCLDSELPRISGALRVRTG